MPKLIDVLAHSGLSQYFDVLIGNGFDSWETVLNITEAELHELGFKLGHRRALQRQIASYKGHPRSESLDRVKLISTGSSSLRSLFASDSSPGTTASQRFQIRQGREGRRKYRRHPKADENAPKKPKTAYVSFADHLRTDASIASLGFVDIAKEVGRRWQQLDPEEKRTSECQAARAMQEYEAQMDGYRSTEDYKRYQLYLASFKREHREAKEKKEDAAMKSRSEKRGGSISSGYVAGTSDAERGNTSLRVGSRTFIAPCFMSVTLS